ncbi:MAG: phosphatidylglycerophosphatase A [Pseudomonadales bacterium]
MKIKPIDIIAHPVHFLSLGLGSGLSPKAPGTVGTVMALVIYYLVLRDLSLELYLLVLAVSIIVGIWLCDRTAKALGAHDHPAIVWDEFAGLWLALVVLPVGWYWPLLGFIIFRVFDIAKPWPISWLDKKVHGGLGIMVDDLLAGLFTLAALQLLALVL